MATYKLNLMIVQGFTSSISVGERIEEYGAPRNSDFGVLECIATPLAVQVDMYRKKLRVVRSVNKKKQIDTEEVDDLKPISFKLWVNRDLLEVYSGSSCNDVLDYFSELGLEFNHAAPSLDLLKAVQELRGLNGFKIVKIEGMEYLGPGEASGTYTAKFEDPESAIEFLEGEHGEHATKVTVRFRSMNGSASIAMQPNGCFSITCKEDDLHCMFDRCRDLINVARQEDG